MTPKVKITIPRMELVAAVNSVRLAKKTREALRIALTGTRFFTDSSAVLGMLKMESGKFNEFVGARVSEVKVNSNIEEEWRWLEENCNPADLGTRSNATPQAGRIPDRKAMDGQTRGYLAMQEVVQPLSRGRV